MLDHENIINT